MIEPFAGTAEVRSADAEPADVERVTQALRRAQHGFKSDVEHLIHALQGAVLLVPLAKSIPDVPLGDVRDIPDDLDLAPQVLSEPGGTVHLPLFSEGRFVTEVERQVGWTTQGKPLEVCTLPAEAALELALLAVDGERVSACVFNPGAESQLVLSRPELASVAQRRALPLVGYVSQLPSGAALSEQTLVAELSEPMPPVLLAALDRALKEEEALVSYRIMQTFHAERDLEPHPTLIFQVRASSFDPARVHALITRTLEGRLPAPGYIDILFESLPDDAG